MATYTRRQCLANLVLCGMCGVRTAAAHAASGDSAPRVFAAEWAGAETLVAIGVQPVATGNAYLMQGGADGGVPDVPKIGSIFAPNLEELQRLRPDLIVCADWQSRLLPLFQRIAPTHMFNLRNPPSAGLDNAIGLVVELGKLLGRSAQGEAYIAKARASLDATRRKIEGQSSGAFLIGTLEPDGRHLAFYDENSLLVDVAHHVGIDNAGMGAKATPWGVTTHGVEILADYPDATFLYLDTGPRSDAALRLLKESALWRSLPIVRRGHVLPVRFAWPLGGLPTALAFAQSLAVALGCMRNIRRGG